MNNILTLVFINLLFLLVFVSALKTKNSLVVLYSFFVFIANGLGSTLFYLNKYQFYSHPGSYTVGDFDFYLPRILIYYLPPLLFLVILILVTLILKKATEIDIESLKQLVSFKRIAGFDSSNLDLFFYSLIIFFIFLNMFMYQNSIGIVGLESTTMPFKLSGIMYYLRYMIPPVVLFVFGFFRRKNTTYWIISLILILISGVCSSSRSIPLLGLGVLLFYLVIDSKIFKSYLMLLLILLTFQFMTYGRDYVYENKNHTVRSVVDNITYSVSHFSLIKNIKEFELGLFSISYRLGGVHDLIVVNEANFSKMESLDLIKGLIAGKGLFGENIVSRLYRIPFEEGFAFGASVSPMAMLSIAYENSLKLYACIVIFYVAIFISAELIISNVFKKDIWLVFGLMPRFFVVYFFMSLEFKKILFVLLFCLIVHLSIFLFLSMKNKTFPAKIIKE